MRTIADLHIHSRYSRATSPDMNLDCIHLWARLKGIDVIGTGDFTHPAYFKSIEEKLEPAQHGLFTLKGKSAGNVYFMLTTEVSNIYTQGGRTRKVHNLILTPTIEGVRRMNSAFQRLGNISSDGRPIFGFSSKDLVKIVLDASPDSMVIPAHAWTPWFSVFGSRSGFDSIEECFGEFSKYIHAIETGLSSNPQMNWRLSSLDGITLISNSDAHSPRKLGREANVFDCSPDYYGITDIIKKKDRKKFLYTIEFFPEEGKYHADGHRNCGVTMTPEETREAGKTCPVCGKELTVGVMTRVEELSDRPAGFVPENAVPARHIVPLEEIVSEAIGKGVNTASVRREYKRLTDIAGSEFALLLDIPEDELVKAAGPKISEGIMKVRRGDITISPGFDGEFGKIRIFPEKAPEKPAEGQITLF